MTLLDKERRYAESNAAAARVILAKSAAGDPEYPPDCCAVQVATAELQKHQATIEAETQTK